MSRTKVICQIEDQAATILLVPPEGKPPTLDHDVLDELETCIEQVRDACPKLVCVRSSSDRFFCVGANLNVLKETNRETIVPWVKKGHRVLNQLEDLPMPVVAVVEGYVMGGGLELAMACDLIFALDTAQAAQSEAGLGFIPGWGGTRRLPNRVGKAKAKYLFYSGKIVAAPDAVEMGLFDFCGSKKELKKELSNFSEAVMVASSNALRQFKTILNDQEREFREKNGQVESVRSVTCLQNTDTQKRLHDFLTKKGKK